MIRHTTLPISGVGAPARRPRPGADGPVMIVRPRTTLTAPAEPCHGCAAGPALARIEQALARLIDDVGALRERLDALDGGTPAS